MSKKTLIYTEGKSDKNFLSWCLDVWEYQAHFDIIHVDGKNKLFSDEFYEKIENILTNNNPRYKQVCIIFDADIKKKRTEKAMQVLITSLSIFMKNSKKKGLIFPKNKSFYSLTIKMMAI
ncbi:DUF3226 domain-containing protein [Helicobacter pylori]|uniref:DUF3226 domain-containing protein n=1 Tax=Helicobacter pylori TaxID=210 RepID=UPI002FBE96D7